MGRIPTMRIAILKDLAEAGPMTGAFIRETYGAYGYPCAYTMMADRLVELDGRTRTFRITDEGRAYLDRWTRATA